MVLAEKEVKPEEEKFVEEKPVFEEEIEKPEKKKSYTILYLLGGAIVAGVVLALLLGKKEEGKGSIDVRSTPTGARIYLDGADTGKVTNAVLADVKAGSHSITLKKELFQDYSTSVNVSKNQTANVNAELFAAPFNENFNDGIANYWKYSGPGEWRVIAYEYSSAIKKWANWNNLKVVVSGTNFTFYINGVRVGSISDASYSKGKVGVFTRDYDYVDVDNVSVYLSTAGSFAGEPAIPMLVSPDKAFKKIQK